MTKVKKRNENSKRGSQKQYPITFIPQQSTLDISDESKGTSLSESFLSFNKIVLQCEGGELYQSKC